MKRIQFTMFLLILNIPAVVQSQTNKQESVLQSSVEKHIYFLASDELRGRNTGTPELQIAARYIASAFLAGGVEPVTNFENFFQPVPFRQSYAPEAGTFTAGGPVFSLGDDFISLGSARGTFEGFLRVLEYGTKEEVAGKNVEGSIVMVRSGYPGQSSVQQWFAAAREKNNHLREAGAIAVVELYESNQLPWSTLVRYLNRDQFTLDEDQIRGETEIPHIWLNVSGKNLYSQFSETAPKTANLKIEGKPATKITSNNVIGYIEGTDPDLKGEHILLSAHYDHIGVNPNIAEGDSIYNGARDNAIGTAAVIEAAGYFSKNPPRRSVIVAGWTAEEKGLLGSGYFADHPAVPLHQIIYNLNIDGGGYNDTTKVTVIGLGRTEADSQIAEAAEAFGLQAIPDPVPEQNLFDRSDNVHFARNGIPAPTYSTGFTAFDDEINDYYHQVTDNPDTINYSYITRYIRSYIYAAEAIANMDQAPFWLPGDKYEEAGKELYGLE